MNYVKEDGKRRKDTGSQELKCVRDKLFAALDSNDIRGCLILNPQNIRYLTGFHGLDSALFVLEGKYYLITDKRYDEEAGECAFFDELITRTDSIAVTAGNLSKSLKAGPICITASNISCADYKQFLDAAGERATVRLLKEGVVEALRTCKTKTELQSIKKCLEIGEKAFSQFKDSIEAGRSEKWLSAKLDFLMRCSGADKASFSTICAVSEHASRPHAVPTERAVSAGESILVDWGAGLDGYNSDLTRVIALGKMPEKVKELSDIVIEAQQAALSMLKPGVSAAEVDSAARSVISEAGHGSCFFHGLGHGVGLDVHEAPVLAPGKGQKLQPGMVITIEPAIYIRDVCGVRIEDMVYITDEGYERLSSLNKEPVCI